MKPARIVMLMLLATFVAACDRAPPPPTTPVDVGGISLGMSVDAYREVTAKAPGFQIGGVRGTPGATFVDGKLATFSWRFPTSQYMVVRRALLNQFPHLACETANGQEVCKAKGDSVVSLSEGQRGTWSSQVWLEPAGRVAK